MLKFAQALLWGYSSGDVGDLYPGVTEFTSGHLLGLAEHLTTEQPLLADEIRKAAKVALRMAGATNEEAAKAEPIEPTVRHQRHSWATPKPAQLQRLPFGKLPARKVRGMRTFTGAELAEPALFGKDDERLQLPGVELPPPVRGDQAEFPFALIMDSKIAYSACKKCTKAIQFRARILFLGKGKGAYHIECAPAELIELAGQCIGKRGKIGSAQVPLVSVPPKPGDVLKQLGMSQLTTRPVRQGEDARRDELDRQRRMLMALAAEDERKRGNGG